MAWLNSNHKEIFANPLVEFKSANLINPVSCAAAFDDTDEPFDFTINLAGETKLNLPESIYKEGILHLSTNCAKEAAAHHVKRYVEVSSGHMYSAGKKPSAEESEIDPWTVSASFKLQVEHALELMTELDYVILRPALVYGIADKRSLTPRLLVGAVYKHLGEMKLLWTKDLKMDTVHVSDLCRAIWHVCLHGKRGEVFNVVDGGNTTQGKVTDIISEIFNINHDYLGVALSLLAKANMQSAVEDINEKHLPPWAESCQKDNVINTPLSPYLSQELLSDRDLWLDGNKLLRTSFTYQVPELQKAHIEDVLNDYVQMGIFPKSLLA
ncbi:uncharacterized protein LOC135385538 isoform X2 [Ornithodoros turicata]